MTNWEFKSFTGDLSKAQQKRAKWYAKALEKANGSSVAQPIFSGYHVKTAIGPVKSRFYTAGNIEYGDRKALHAEECAVGAYFSRTNGRLDSFQPPILALIAGSPGNPATPCGNCRDILLQAFGPKLEIVSGAPEGGVAIVATLEQYLFVNFTTISASVTEEIQKLTEKAWHCGEKSERDAYSSAASLAAFPHYRVSIKYDCCSWNTEKRFTGTSGGNGSLGLGCEYHPLYPIRDALRALERTQIKRVQLQKVVIVANGDPYTPPHVPYRDRQHLLEFHLASGKEGKPEIYLFRTKNKKIVGAWQTDHQEWLPMPFSPTNFGKEFMTGFRAYHKRKNEF